MLFFIISWTVLGAFIIDDYINIVIRKADKSNTFVILNRDDYISKINNILNDKTKFKKIQKNPTKLLKAQVNRLIESVNALSGKQKRNQIICEYELGYIYGHVKTHKAENPLRPIIINVIK